MKLSDAPRRRKLAVSALALLVAMSVSSCAQAPEAAFREFVNETPTAEGILDLSSFAEWDEAQLRCADGKAPRNEDGELDFGQLVMYLNGEVVLSYTPAVDDKIFFCPELFGETFDLRYPDGILVLERSEPIASPLNYDFVATYLSVPSD